MRRCEALPGARVELLLDLLIPQQDGQLGEGTLLIPSCPCRNVEHPDAWVPRLIQSSPQARLSSLPLFSIPQMSSFQFRQSILSAGPSLACFLPLALWPGAGRPWSCASAQGEAQMLRIQPWRRNWWTQPSPALPWVGVLKGWSPGESGWE